MFIKLKTIKEECGGCPTLFKDFTESGELFVARLRHGFMNITLNDIECYPNGLNGVCRYEDFKTQTALRGYFIDDSKAEYSSRITEIEEAIIETFKDVVKVEFLVDCEATDYGDSYKKGKTYKAKIEITELLVEKGLAVINDDTYERKKQLSKNK